MREPDTVPWLVVSIALSVVLTVLLNVGLRLFPGAGRRVADEVAKRSLPPTSEMSESDRRVRVWIPWKAMIVGSVVLTIVVNLLFWIARP